MFLQNCRKGRYRLQIVTLFGMAAASNGLRKLLAFSMMLLLSIAVDEWFGPEMACEQRKWIDQA